MGSSLQISSAWLSNDSGIKPVNYVEPIVLNDFGFPFAEQAPGDERIDTSQIFYTGYDCFADKVPSLSNRLVRGVSDFFRNVAMQYDNAVEQMGVDVTGLNQPYSDFRNL